MPKEQPPIASKKPTYLTQHGHERVDQYYWLRDDTRQSQEVLDYLAAENQYTAKALAATEPLQHRLYEEIAGRLVADDQTVPVALGDYEYYREYRQGGEYPIYMRRDQSGGTETLLDVNELASGHDYFSVGNWSVTFDEKRLAYVTDSLSRRIYKLQVKDLGSGELLQDEIPGVAASIAWSADGNQLFYVRRDPDTLLPYQVYRHTLGEPHSSDVLVYEEQDQAFSTRVYNTRSKAFVVIASHSTNSTEIRVIPSANSTEKPRLILAREPDHEYRIRHAGEQFFIVSNWQAQNFRLLQVHQDELGDKQKWQEVIPHDGDRLISDFEVFNDHIVVLEQHRALPEIRIMDRRSGQIANVEFTDGAYSAWLHTNPSPESHELRFGYSSLTTPNSVYSYDMTSGDRKLLKQDTVRGQFAADNYKSLRIEIEARDGTKVPVSLVYREDKFKKGQQPLYITGYGAYGYSSEPYFSSKRLSLLDRGFVFAIAHVRGGEELGRVWYEDGKLLNKRNTFWDFIDVTKGLVDAGYGHPEKVIAMGASAGGLLMGVVANEAPELYQGIVAHVPFVDALTTMLDETIPLTTGEFTEWGNPMQQAYYDYILQYSPYDQVQRQDYPHLLVTTGLHDSQVQYFEPAKWVAKLRDMKTDDNLLLLHTDMTTGHGGASGRYEQYRADAMEYAFVLNILGIDQ